MSHLMHLEIYVRGFRMKKYLKIISIKSDHRGEFENGLFKHFFEEKGISHNFSCPRTLQQHGVVERKNRTLQEMVRTLLSEFGIQNYFLGRSCMYSMLHSE